MKIPKNEIEWESIYGADSSLPYNKLLYVITSKQDRSVYYLYQNVDGDFKKLGKASDPLSLKKKYIKT